MLYRLETKDNGFLSLQYLTFAYLWFYSDSYGHKIDEFISSDLTEEVTKEEMDRYIAIQKEKETANGHDK